MATPADKRFHQLTLAIQKAMNAVETPVKEKHVRSAIIGTFQEQSAITYWMVAIRQPLQDNRIVAWKFCHVTHKLLREGHPACLDDSQRHIGMIENLGKLWMHLREGYGRLIHLYCTLLLSKLKFHARNPRFPGNMQLTVEELDAIAENDVNNYFQLCVELFDYMDDILNLQSAVFDSLGNARANSMTASGQCRLAALIPCAQDSSHIYDCNVRLLFRLHASLPADTLSGHRERFRQQFKKLSSFYKHASSLQYYRNLLTLPVLPSNPPNFLLQSDFGTYVAPVVSIPEPPPDEVDAIGSLIDTSETISQVSTPPRHDSLETRATPSPAPDPLLERDRLIDHLQTELKRMRTEVSQIVQERNTMLSSMREHCARVETQLHAARNELEEEKQKADILAVEAPEIKKKLSETEEKAKVTDEKFQKLKGAYTQLREEHIALIRQKAEVDKLTSSLRAAAAQHESAKMMLQQQLNDRVKDVELLQQSASSSEEIEAYKIEISNLRTDLEQSRQKEVELETLRASIESLQIDHKTATTEQEEKISIMASELKEASESLDRLKKEKIESEAELAKVKEELQSIKQKSGEDYKKVVQEKEEAQKQITELTIKYQQEKEAETHRTNALQTELDNLKTKLSDSESSLQKECFELNELIKSKNSEFEECLKEKDREIQEALEKLTSINIELENCKLQYETTLQNKHSETQALANELDEVKKTSTESLRNLEFQLESLKAQLEEETSNKVMLQNTLSDEQSEIFNLKNKIEHLEQSKNEEISRLKEEFNEVVMAKTQEYSLLAEEKSKLVEENEKLLNELSSEKQVLQQTVDQLQEERDELNKKLEITQSEKVEIEQSLKQEINNLKIETNQIKLESDNDLGILKEKYQNSQQDFNNQLAVKDSDIEHLNTEVEILKSNLSELEKIKNDQKISFERIVDDKNNDIQLMEARLMHTEQGRLNAECELQDLLQQNTVLEADMASLKIQLEEAHREIKKQNSKIVSCAGEAALEVTNTAISTLEHSNAQDANKLAAELASKAFEELARKSQLEGNEEAVAKSAIFAAHNAAQLSSYASEVSNLSTDLELIEKLNNDCRSMLTATKQCLESLKSGAIDRSVCLEARTSVQTVSRNATAADRLVTGTRSVDDELAEMDLAIEQAASQIENLLAASKAGDSGVQLEVNSKILDACTTLMGAVKVLVQDARKLQNELGDPKTRQKMYRRNPQWSEGLISAAKSVVFAAKLLVTSADEAVSSAGGKVEGVSAAAHEVAGSTAQLVAASRARAPPSAPALTRLTAASRHVAAATGALVAAVRSASALVRDKEALDTSALTLTATRRLEMESKVRALELESALDAERARLAALRKRHYHLAHLEENGNIENGKE
ncbi:huntingtin-interacting protein 1 isoform X3 [Colias croceus]|uniref:huntingtin-interacting protein 1 isoform X3 n=1 Tax=Colias crocea TaxID=72248 RepID=UPI001E27F24C|nr:huntingtin-interacting protein 1 isoform X3 [Colias croceus]